ncbi:hypothetical protein Hanom_Chr02g00159681 [Helianthus anomalus]
MLNSNKTHQTHHFWVCLVEQGGRGRPGYFPNPSFTLKLAKLKPQICSKSSSKHKLVITSL